MSSTIFESLEFEAINDMFEFINSKSIEHFIAENVHIKHNGFNNLVPANHLKTINIQRFDISTITETTFWFNHSCPNIERIEINHLISPALMITANMFSNLKQLQTVILNADLPNVHESHHMFANCPVLKNITGNIRFSSKLKSAHRMFEGCKALVPKSISSIRTYNADISNIFKECLFETALLQTLANNNKQTEPTKEERFFNNIETLISSYFDETLSTINNVQTSITQELHDTVDSKIQALDKRLTDETQSSSIAVAQSVNNVTNIVERITSSVEQIDKRIKSLEEKQPWTPLPRFTKEEAFANVKSLINEVVDNQKLFEESYVITNQKEFEKRIFYLFIERYSWERYEFPGLKRIITDCTIRKICQIKRKRSCN